MGHSKRLKIIVIATLILGLTVNLLHGSKLEKLAALAMILKAQGGGFSRGKLGGSSYVPIIHSGKGGGGGGHNKHEQDVQIVVHKYRGGGGGHHNQGGNYHAHHHHHHYHHHHHHGPYGW